jgi:hypothetical protein
MWKREERREKRGETGYKLTPNLGTKIKKLY